MSTNNEHSEHSEHSEKLAIVAAVLAIVDAYIARGNENPWTKADRSHWERHAHKATIEVLRASHEKAEVAWGQSAGEMPLVVIEIAAGDSERKRNAPRDPLARTCQVMHAVQILDGRRSLLAPARQVPAWVKAAAGVVGFLGGLAWGMMPANAEAAMQILGVR